MNKGLFIVLLSGFCGIFAYSQNINVFTYQIGRFEVNMLVEALRPGSTDILIGVDDAMTGRYLNNGDFMSQTNVFLIRSPDRVILIDTGFGTTMFESMESLGVSPDQVDAVLITHMHGDHFGGLQKDGKPLFPKAQIYLAKREYDDVTKTSVNKAGVDALAPYGSRVSTFAPGELGRRVSDLLPGITALAAFGHTPGHTMFMLSSEGKQLLIWGDLMHVMGIQFALPDMAVTYDRDPKAAVASRKKVLAYAAKNKIPIAGMHLLSPAIGDVTAQGSGYLFTPASER